MKPLSKPGLRWLLLLPAVLLMSTVLWASWAVGAPPAVAGLLFVLLLLGTALSIRVLRTGWQGSKMLLCGDRYCRSRQTVADDNLVSAAPSV